MLRTTMGQLLVNQVLPEDMRDHNRTLDKKGIKELLNELAVKHPDKYVEVSKKLSDIGHNVATEFGGYSFGLEHLKKSNVGRKYQDSLKTRMKQILDDDNLTAEQRHELIIKAAGSVQQKQINEIYAEAKAGNNPLAMQVLSGSRGNEMNLTSLLGSDMLYSDHHDRTIPLPVMSSYSQGLKPVEYWAATYGARRGTMATKFATQNAGFLSKQLNQVSHRLLISGEDSDDNMPNRGLPVDTTDPGNAGALLAKDFGPYKRNTPLTPKILRHIKSLGHDRILVRSPIVGGSPDGGVYARDVGIRERGTLPGRGEQVGLTAAQALSEPISQGQLSAKHSGGVAGQEKAVGGFAYINQLIQVPQKFKGGAAHSDYDGTVSNIEKAPAGGNYVWIDDKRHYVPAGSDLKVKRGDRIEAGDAISDGFPDPSVITHYKGVGEGKRYFVEAFHRAMKDAGINVERRNVELLARGLINHVRLTDEYGDHVPDDVVPYSTMESLYEPRKDHRVTHPKKALGQYLEKPVLHYSIGTKIRPSVLKELEHFGIDEVTTHAEPPPFQPEMIRGMSSLRHDPDWMTRMYGSGLKDSLLDSVHHGATSNELGTSFVPSLARAVDFGRIGAVQAPQKGTPAPPEGQPFGKIQPPSVTTTKKPGLFSGLFKSSEDIEKEAAVCLAKTIHGVRPIVQSKLSNGMAKPVRGIRLAKQADDPLKPKVDSTLKPTSGSSTDGQATTTAKPLGFQMNANVPTSGMSFSGQAVPQHEIKLIGHDGGGQNQLSQPQTSSPSAPPGEVHPDRISGSWRSGVGGGYNPNTFTQNPNAFSDGYVPGEGLMQRTDDPQMLANFVQGGGNSNDPSSGYGGQLGAVTRFGSLMDTNAVAALTSGNHYVPGSYGGGGHSHDLLGGRPAQMPGGDWVSSVLESSPPNTPATTQQPDGMSAARAKDLKGVGTAALMTAPGAAMSSYNLLKGKPVVPTPGVASAAPAVAAEATAGSKAVSGAKAVGKGIGKFLPFIGWGMDAYGVHSDAKARADATTEGQSGTPNVQMNKYMNAYGQGWKDQGMTEMGDTLKGLRGDRGIGGIAASLVKPITNPVASINSGVQFGRNLIDAADGTYSSQKKEQQEAKARGVGGPNKLKGVFDNQPAPGSPEEAARNKSFEEMMARLRKPPEPSEPLGPNPFGPTTQLPSRAEGPYNPNE